MVGRHGGHFRVGQSPAQKDYLAWKHAMLEPFSRPITEVGNGLGFSTLTMPALADLHTALYDSSGRRQATNATLDRLDVRGLAVWYGDDGSFMGSHARWGKGKAVIYNQSLRGKSPQAIIATLKRLAFHTVPDHCRRVW